MKKNNLKEEITRIHQLIGVRTENYVTPHIIREDEGEDEKIGSFDFGRFGKVYYLKEGFEAYYIPDDFDIPDIFDLKQVEGSTYGQDNFGWYEEFIKESWGTQTVMKVSKETGEKRQVEEPYTIKRYFPSKYWEDLQWLKTNKVPIGFKNAGKVYTLVIKLFNPVESVFPASDKIVAPLIRPQGDQSRGWIMSFPGLRGSGSMDWGSAYYGSDGVQYNMIAPTDESDQTTWALDARTWFQQLVMSEGGQLFILIAQIAISVLSRKFLVGRMSNPASIFFTADPVKIQFRLMVAQTIVELGFNVPQAIAYFDVPGGESIAWLNLFFCALPYISTQPGFINIIGQEFSAVECVAIANKSMRNLIAKDLSNIFESSFYASLNQNEKAIFLNVCENISKNPKFIEESLAYIVGQSKGLKTIGEGVVPEVGSELFELYQIALNIRGLLKEPTQGWFNGIVTSMTGVLVLQHFTISLLNKLYTKTETLEDYENKQDDLKEQIKSMDEAFNEGFTSYEKLQLSNPTFVNIMVFDLSPENILLMLESGVIPTDIQGNIISEAVRSALSDIDKLKKMKQVIDANNEALKYLRDERCWEDIEKYVDDDDLIQEVIDTLEEVNYTLSTNSSDCVEAGLVKCKTAPCWVLKKESEIVKGIAKQPSADQGQEDVTKVDVSYYERNRNIIYLALSTKKIPNTDMMYTSLEYDKFKVDYFDTQSGADELYKQLYDWGLFRLDKKTYYQKYFCDMEWALNKVEGCIVNIEQPKQSDNVKLTTAETGKEVVFTNK